MSYALKCSDAIFWLQENRDLGAVITSLPDAEEVDMTVPKWGPWFIDAATLCLRATKQNGPTVFYQTDRKNLGGTASKASMLLRAAQWEGRRLLWHKIVLRRGVGKIDLHRPGYTHLMAFGGEKTKPGKATPDVIEAGAMLYPNAMGANAALTACKFAAQHSDIIYDPFCGKGAVLVAALQLGLSAVGNDIDPRQIEAARKNIEASLFT